MDPKFTLSQSTLKAQYRDIGGGGMDRLAEVGFCLKKDPDLFHFVTVLRIKVQSFLEASSSQRRTHLPFCYKTVQIENYIIS